uniref:Uncharacterized protein n=1 Tax=Acrobeloides nanus TaxID=290746 RepID=A0A914DAR9_9BILA
MLGVLVDVSASMKDLFTKLQLEDRQVSRIESVFTTIFDLVKQEADTIAMLRDSPSLETLGSTVIME